MSLSNKEIAKQFQLLGQIMELHQENPFKIRSYQSAYITLRKWGTPLSEMAPDQLDNIPGVGKAIKDKIQQLLDTGTIETLERYKSMTPEGIVELLGIKGVGPKKIRQIWKELEIESPGELYYACVENRLVDLKGFGAKTQASIRDQLEYYFESRDKFLYGHIYPLAMEMLDQLRLNNPDFIIEFTGQIRRKLPVLDEISVLAVGKGTVQLGTFFNGQWDKTDWRGRYQEKFELNIVHCEPLSQGAAWLKTTGPEWYIQKFTEISSGKTEEEIHSENEMPFLPPELRDEASGSMPTNGLIVPEQIKGVIHAHTDWSDGTSSLEALANHCQSLGYQYLLVTDHSKSAFYANGLQPDRVINQWQEIDRLNNQLDGFKIFKGIESDILYDGSLDYDESILSGFDAIIASVHSQLKMDEKKATERLIAAIENPYTRILGHPTGRLLLSRKGYPINHQKIIDACIANYVVIEINASPYRLDLDWTWVVKVIEVGGMLSINPDAHSLEGVNDIRWGVEAARKAGLSADRNLSSLDVHKMTQWAKDKSSLF